MGYDDIDPLDQAAYDTVHGYRDARSGRRGIGPLADMIGMAPSTLQNKTDRKQEFANLNVKEVRALMLATGDYRLLETLAHGVGYAAVPLPSVASTADMDLLDAWAQWSAEFGETAQTIKAALDDGRVTTDEIARCRQELIEDFEKGLGILDVLKGMAEPDEKVVQIKKAQ